MKPVSTHLIGCYATFLALEAALEDGSRGYKEKFYRVRSFHRARMQKNYASDGACPFPSFFRLQVGALLRGRVCAYCGTCEHLSVDHLVAQLKGGPDDANNLVPACRTCNASKGACDVLTWHKRIDRFPTVRILQRYTKLAWAAAAREGILECDRESEEVRRIPFEILDIPSSVTGGRRGLPPGLRGVRVGW